jgi:sarcosine oxidase subunit beta
MDWRAAFSTSGSVVTGDLGVSCEIAVVGAGITGLSSALALARAGVGPVVVVERSGVGAEASGVQPGGVRQQWSTRVNCLLARESADYFRNLGDHLDASVSPVLESCGYIFLAHSAKQLDRLTADVAVQNAAGVPSVILTPDQAADVVPDLTIDSIVGAAWCSEDGYFDRPQSVVEAFAQAAEREGVSIVIAQVEELRSANEGWTLVLADGRKLFAPAVVIATGCDAPAMVAPLGIELPIRKDPRYLFLSEPIRERLLEPLVVSGERAFAAKQLANGRVLASDLTAYGESAPDSDARRKTIREHIEQLLPRLQYVSLPVVVEGTYDTTPDHQPVVAEFDSGLWVSAGFSGHGFMLAPAIARRLAAAIAGGSDDDLLSAFSHERFSLPELVYESAVV